MLLCYYYHCTHLIKPVSSKEYQLWIFFERTDAEAEAPILRLPDAKSWHTGGKNADAGENRGHEEKAAIEEEMFG